MTKFSKVIGISAAVVAIGALGAFAFAQGPHGMGGQGMGHGMKMGMGPGMKMGGQMADPAARLATLKTELAITPAQEPAWSIYTKVVVDTATAQKAQHEKIDRDAVHKMAPNDRQAFMTGQQTQRQAAMATVRMAADTLLAALDEPQKAKARDSLPGLVDHGAGPMRHGMMGDHGMKGGMPGSGRPQ